MVASAILAGLVIALGAGALDRAGLVDLRLLRTPDPFTNLTGAERLQSTFWAGSPDMKRRYCQKFSPGPARRRPCNP